MGLRNGNREEENYIALGLAVDVSAELERKVQQKGGRLNCITVNQRT